MLGSSVGDCCTPFDEASPLQATNQVLAFVKDSGGHVHAHGWQLVGSASGCTLVDQQVQVDSAQMMMSRQMPAACHPPRLLIPNVAHASYLLQTKPLQCLSPVPVSAQCSTCLYTCYQELLHMLAVCI